MGRCVTLANENVDQEIRRATIPYSPLYPTFQDRLNAFRQGEHAELLQRGAERVIHNVGLYDSRRSSEDRSVDAAVLRPADTALPGPLEDSVEQEERAPQGEEPPPRADSADGNMVSERGWLVFLVLLYLVASVMVLAADNFTKKEWTEREAEKELEKAGVTLADILRQITELREDNERLREEVRKERTAWTQLNEEMQHLKLENERLRSRMEEEIISEVLSEGRKRYLEATRTWWEWFWGIAPPSVVAETERVVVIDGCKDLGCCFELWWASVGELFRQTTNLLYQFIWDPYGTGGHWVTRIFRAGFWGPVVGVLLVLILVNLLIYGIMRAADVWKGMKWVAGCLGRLPMIAMWGQLFTNLRGPAPGDKSAELKEIRREIQQVKRRISDRERKRKEEEEYQALQEAREELRGMQADYGRQEATTGNVLKELQKDLQRVQSEVRQLRGQGRGPTPPVVVGTRPRPGTSSPPPRRVNAPGTPRVAVRACQHCGRFHSGECWQVTPCPECGESGVCGHRRAILQGSRGQQPSRATSRAASRTGDRPVSMCSEERADQELLSELQVRLEDESSANSSISLNVESRSRGQTGEPEEVAVLATASERAHVEGQIVHGTETKGRRFLIDSGAAVNLLSEVTCRKLGLGPQETGIRVCALAGTKLRVIGRVTALTRLCGMERELTYLVVENNDQDIIGFPGMTAFGIKLDLHKGTLTVTGEQELSCRSVQKN